MNICLSVETSNNSCTSFSDVVPTFGVDLIRTASLCSNKQTSTRHRDRLSCKQHVKLLRYDNMFDIISHVMLDRNDLMMIFLIYIQTGSHDLDKTKQKLQKEQ